jgi:hypothetical protein
MVPQQARSLLVACLLLGCLLNKVSEDWWSAMDVLGYRWLPPLLCQASVCRPSGHHVDEGDGLDP